MLLPRRLSGKALNTQELTEVGGRLLSIIAEGSWKLGMSQKSGRRLMSPPPTHQGLKGGPRPTSLMSVPAKIMEQILLEALTSQMKHETGKSQHGFTECKSCLTNPITFYNQLTCSADAGRAVGTAHLDFSKAFHMDSKGHLLQKPTCSSSDKWSVQRGGTG